MLIRHAQRIKKIQKKIWEQAYKREVYDYITSQYYLKDVIYSNVPRETFEIFRTYIDNAHIETERIRKWIIEEDFREKALFLLENKISLYYHSMGLDYTPLKDKIEEKTIEWGCSLAAIAGLLILFGFIAKCAAAS